MSDSKMISRANAPRSADLHHAAPSRRSAVRWRRGGIACVVAVALVSTAVPAPQRGIAATGERVDLRGAGATFPAPLYQKWIDVFRRQEPDVAIAYDVVGSGEGQRRFIGGDVDFGASDAALNDEQMSGCLQGPASSPSPRGSSSWPTTSGVLAAR